MGVQVCFPMHLYGKKHLKILFSKTEDALWLNLCIYYWEHLHVCSSYVTQVSEPWPVGLLFYTPPHNSGGVLWFHVGHPSVCPSVIRPSVFRFLMITWVNINGFSPNLVCALVLWRSGLGLLIGKFRQFLTELSAQDTPIFSFPDYNLSK